MMTGKAWNTIIMDGTQEFVNNAKEQVQMDTGNRKFGTGQAKVKTT
jgi:hypothetical protein